MQYLLQKKYVEQNEIRKMIMHFELESSEGEEVMVCFKLLAWHSFGRTEGKPQSIQPLSWLRFQLNSHKYKSDI
jgi:hypothetical protein